MGCVKLHILDRQYKTAELRISYQKKELTPNFDIKMHVVVDLAVTGAFVMLFNHMMHEGKDDNPKKKNNTFDIDKAVTELDNKAEAASTGKCAAYVRKAIEAGGISTSNRPNYAKDYGSYLEEWGFEEITTTNYQKGDIAVFQNYEGGSVAGHIQMYNGSQWVSDFKQSGFWPGSGYRKNEPSYSIYRWQ